MPTICSSPSFFDLLQSFPPRTFTSINGSLWRDSLFVSISSFDEKIRIFTTTCSRIMNVHKKHNFFVSVCTIAQWVKLAQPVEAVFLTPTSLTAP